MKHSTFYKDKKESRVYTTIKNTPYHKFLRDDCEGVTYQHDDKAKLYFMYPLALDKPIGKNVKRVN